VFDLDALQAAIDAHGRVARVVIAAFEGSSPREVGAAMLVWADASLGGGQSGTIGGGALEFEAVARARELLAESLPVPPTPSPQGGGETLGAHLATDDLRDLPPPLVGEGWGGGAPAKVERVSLGPALGQCCGGAVTLWTEVFEEVPVPEDGVIARGPGAMPLAVKRIVARARGQGVMPLPQLVQGWFVEPVARAERQVWVWGAGHVGRALVSVLAPLPGVALTWVDVSAERFPDVVPAGVRVLPVAKPEVAVALASREAEHLVATFSHALDLELCHRLLGHGFRSAGLIGSTTKWARFRARLAALGHSREAILTIRCPIGDPSLGKHPQAIAVGVAAEFLAASGVSVGRRDRA
jgi:xanthine dehydrogenase accessory factor